MAEIKTTSKRRTDLLTVSLFIRWGPLLPDFLFIFKFIRRLGL